MLRGRRMPRARRAAWIRAAWIQAASMRAQSTWAGRSFTRRVYVPGPRHPLPPRVTTRPSAPRTGISVDGMADREYGFKTRAIHAGNIPPDEVTGARALPIYQSSAFVFDDTADAAARFALQKYGNIYSRLANPTVASFEERVASLEGGLGAVATASGLAAQYIVFASLAGAGDHIVASANLYGGSITQLDVTLRRFGVDTTFVRSSDAADYAAAITDQTKALFVETIANPSGEIADLEALADVAHAAGIPFIVDSTIATPPYLNRPIEWGRRHRHALGDEVPRRPRHDPRRRRRRVGPVRLAQRPLPAPQPARAELRRARVERQLRRVRVPHTASRRAAARHRAALAPHSAFLLAQGVETLPPTASRRTSTTRARSPSGSSPTRASSACSGPACRTTRTTSVRRSTCRSVRDRCSASRSRADARSASSSSRT